jgi:uncharacterized membrane protein (UPF0136 family)
LCFAVAAIGSQWASAPRPAIGVTFFVGSVFFTAAAYLQFRQGKDSASLIQLAGTLFFNVSCFAGMRHGLDTKQTDLRVWTPDAFGSVCFLVASEMALRQVCGRWVCVRRGSTEWRIAGLNMLGSIAFGVAAVASLVQPSTAEPVSAAVANAGTALGALCFLAGALMLVAQSQGQVAATPGPVRVSERTPSR